MPLLLTLSEPLLTAAGLPISEVYAIVNDFHIVRLTRRADFNLGYYVREAASLPGSGLAPLSLALPTSLGFQVALEQVGQMGNPLDVLEAYATSVLLPLLGEGATIETVA